MAVSLAILPPPLTLCGKRFSSIDGLQKLPLSKISGKRINLVVTKAVGDSSDSSSGSIVKSVQNLWSSPEDRIALAGLGFAAIAAIWASSNFISAIDKLPLLPNLFEFIGILFSSWFIYRYLLFKPDREELVKIINSSISRVLGQ
ncbi:hypothetical protein LUZ60_001106 [Juncus effusus]|nr:hypothetical protein LUZ60_001106 [Juncus effusus]